METPESAASPSARKQASAFLEKLYDILESPTHAEYIGWQVNVPEAFLPNPNPNLTPTLTLTFPLS